jgi:hypothetical protein
MTADLPWGEHPPKDAGEFFRGLWRLGREAAEKQKQVVEAVRAASEGRTRAQVRVLFEDELRRRDMSPDPIWVERKLDELEWSDAEKAGETAKWLWATGGTLIRMARSHGRSQPLAWMQPPEYASRHVWASNREKTSVDIDVQAVDWLDRALAEAPDRVDNAFALIDVWFDWDTEEADPGRVAVHLGARRVGRLNAQASERLISIMRSAEEDDAKPRAGAQLARAAHLQPPYLLVVEVPVGSTGPSSRQAI